MRWLPFNHQRKGTGEEEKGGIFGRSRDHKVKKGEDLEPKSVLDQRSPSPPTSTLSSSLGGGSAGSTDTADVAAVSDKTAVLKWLASTSTTTAAAAGEAGWRKEDWASEVEMRGLAAGVDDWEMMFTESGASPGQEQTFLRWIMGDVEGPSAATKQRQQQQHMMLSSQSPLVEFDVGSAGLGFGLVDPGFGFESIAGFGGVPLVSASASGISTASLGSSGGLSQISSTSSTKNNQQIVQSPAPQLATASVDKNPIFSLPSTGFGSLPLSFSPAMFFQEPAEEKPQPFGSNLLNQFQQTQISPNPAFFASLPSFTPSPELHQTSNLLLSHLKRHPYIPTDLATGAGSDLLLRLNHPPILPQPNQSLNFTHLHTIPYHLQHRPVKPKSLAAGDEAAAEAMAIQQQQQQALIDELFNAAELVQSGNFVDAHGILARLNHQLPSPIGKPLLRSTFYFKEALQLLANSENPPAAASPLHNRTPFATPLATPLDVVLKFSAYKAFSDVSPVLQFTNFTATQALLEELVTAECIHIIDFDIGVGGQWSSFIQELAQRRSPSAPLLKITAFVSPNAFHPLELHLTRDNLLNFAAELNIPFEINIESIESFDPAEILMRSAGSNEVIAVNLPVGALKGPSYPTLLRLVKQLLPKIVISVDQGCDRSELPFSHHFLHALQSCMVLLDSVDAAGTDLDVANKIERFVLQPRIENCVIGRHRAPDKMLPWRTLFASAGFVPVQFSNFTETQAECLLKRVQVRGFHVEKRQASLYLYWQRGELASVSVWRC